MCGAGDRPQDLMPIRQVFSLFLKHGLPRQASSAAPGLGDRLRAPYPVKCIIKLIVVPKSCILLPVNVYQ